MDRVGSNKLLPDPLTDQVSTGHTIHVVVEVKAGGHAALMRGWMFGGEFDIIRDVVDRRGAGVDERGGLENRCGPLGHRGFESHPLR